MMKIIYSLIVEDNGVGMQPEQVVQINKEMYEDIWVNRTTGFGIAKCKSAGLNYIMEKNMG